MNVKIHMAHQDYVENKVYVLILKDLIPASVLQDMQAIQMSSAKVFSQLFAFIL